MFRESDKRKMSLQLEKIKKIISSNPFKYTNYLDKNSVLMPDRHLSMKSEETEKLQVFKDEMISRNKIFEVELIDTRKEDVLVKQYQLYKKMMEANAKKKEEEEVKKVTVQE